MDIMPILRFVIDIEDLVILILALLLMIVGGVTLILGRVALERGLGDAEATVNGTVSIIAGFVFLLTYKILG